MSEKHLVQKILAGDETAKAELYHRYQKRLTPIGVYFLGYQDPDVEDVVQETFLIALQQLGGFQGKSSLYTWMGRICVHLCYSRLRKRKRLLATQQEDLERICPPHPALSDGPGAMADEQESRITLLRKIVAGMSESCRQVIELRDFEGASYARIGERLKLPIGTVMSRLARCREALKNLAKNELGDKD